MSPHISWDLTPGVLIVAALALAVYVVRWRGARAESSEHRPGVWRLAAWVAGVLTVLAALVSPVDGLGEQLFFMHMVQHVLLLDIAPILLILGLTKVLLRPVTRRLRRIERAAGPFGHPVFAVIAYVAVMWAWHVPGAYDAALRHEGVHVVEHLTFAAAGSLYWWHVLSPIRSRSRLGGLGPLGYMVSTKLLVGALGIAIAFIPYDIYPFYEHLPTFWGLSHHTDQSISGLVMALEQSLIMGVALAYLFVRVLGESERDDRRAERFGTV